MRLSVLPIIGTGVPGDPRRLDAPSVLGGVWSSDPDVTFGLALIPDSDAAIVDAIYPGACLPPGTFDDACDLQGAAPYDATIARLQAYGVTTSGCTPTMTVGLLGLVVAQHLYPAYGNDMTRILPLAQQPPLPPHTILASDIFPASALSGNWFVDAGSWDTVGDVLRYVTGGANQKIRNTVVDQANYFVGAKTLSVAVANTTAHIVGRAKNDGTNNLHWMYSQSATLQLYRRVAGVDTNMISTAMTWTVNDRFIIEFSGDDKRIYVNGVQFGGTVTSVAGEATGQGGIESDSLFAANSSFIVNFGIGTVLAELDAFIDTGNLPAAGTPSAFYDSPVAIGAAIGGL